MSQSGSNNVDERVRELRDSYGSLLDYYFDRPASKESITIGLKVGEVPSAHQAESLKNFIKEAIGVHEIREKLSPWEREQIEQAAASSRLRRQKNKNAKGDGESHS
ncbi:hypothetical protein PRK78_005188 [Emydomyces testavorans]|uniref:Uncharacterized protein n=1 Tax=Emydomyces testavorans TaxID=2070801 RepID=A0AAF0DK67_9EURO|nr:hypothetical protein PRK78_005188 [Emydomyces testavorans]